MLPDDFVNARFSTRTEAAARRRSRYLFLAVPGGLDRWFDAVADAQDAGSLDEALFRALSDEFGIGWLE